MNDNKYLSFGKRGIMGMESLLSKVLWVIFFVLLAVGVVFVLNKLGV